MTRDEQTFCDGIELAIELDRQKAPDEIILQVVYDTVDAQVRDNSGNRAIEHLIAARRARRGGDLTAAAGRYFQAAQSLLESSNQDAHKAVPMLREYAYKVGRGLG